MLGKAINHDADLQGASKCHKGLQMAEIQALKLGAPI